MLECPCIGKHLRSIKNFTKLEYMSRIALHFSDFHQSSTSGLKVKGIYRLNLSARRGDFDTVLLQREQIRIFRLGTLAPSGLNVEYCFQPFLEK